MHLLIEFRVTPLAVISDLIWLYVRLFEDCAYLGLADRRQPRVPRAFGKLIDMLRKERPCPGFG